MRSGKPLVVRGMHSKHGLQCSRDPWLKAHFSGAWLRRKSFRRMASVTKSSRERFVLGSLPARDGSDKKNTAYEGIALVTVRRPAAVKPAVPADPAREGRHAPPVQHIDCPLSGSRPAAVSESDDPRRRFPGARRATIEQHHLLNLLAQIGMVLDERLAEGLFPHRRVHKG
jgi:hypothetical protein